MIRLDSKTNLNFLEQQYKKFEQKEPEDLHITRNINSLDFGLTPAIIQFVSSWHHCFIDSAIIIDIDMIEDIEQMSQDALKVYSEELLDDVYKLDYVFPALAYCWSHKIEDKRNRNLKPLLKFQNEKQHEKMRRQSTGGGLKTFLCCFDQLGTIKGLIPAFYTDGELIDNEMQFDFAIDKSIRKVISINTELRRTNYIPIHTDIIGIIYELIKNTDNWGKTDINNKPIKPNTRGLFMKTHRRTRESFISGFAEHKGLNDYFSEENFEATSSGELYFLELSVFDTGVGFVNRYSRRPTEEFKTEDQVNIVKECLVVNNTSAVGIDKHTKGKGLARIMRILNGKGFFWIRTGNISVFRNLITNQHEDEVGVENIKLFDWKTNSDKEFSNFSSTNGSVITLVYPLINAINV